MQGQIARGLKNFSSAAQILRFPYSDHYADYKIKAAMSHLQMLSFHLRYGSNYSN